MPPSLYAARFGLAPAYIHALRLACGAQRALLPVAVGAMNNHYVRDVRKHHCLIILLLLHYTTNNNRIYIAPLCRNFRGAGIN